MRRTAAAALLALACTSAARAAGPAPIYAVTRISSAIDDGEKVGSKRAGLMCLPQGVVHWGDVATGGSLDQREIVQDALEDAGVAVTPLGEVGGGGERAHLRVRGTVRTAAFRLCAKRFGLGDAKTYSGDVAIEMEWRVEDRASGGMEATHLSKVLRHVDEAHAASVGALYRALLRDSARDLAGWLVKPAG